MSAIPPIIQEPGRNVQGMESGQEGKPLTVNRYRLLRILYFVPSVKLKLLQGYIYILSRSVTPHGSA